MENGQKTGKSSCVFCHILTHIKLDHRDMTFHLWYWATLWLHSFCTVTSRSQLNFFFFFFELYLRCYRYGIFKEIKGLPMSLSCHHCESFVNKKGLYSPSKNFFKGLFYRVLWIESLCLPPRNHDRGILDSWSWNKLFWKLILDKKLTNLNSSTNLIWQWCWKIGSVKSRRW